MDYFFANHFGSFQEEYARHYESQLGFYRPIWDETLRRFFECGDPRFGLARFQCGGCAYNLYVPFSCKTRLFCPSCHQKRLELWQTDVLQHVIHQEMPHRFWTFSIPKRLRIYFQYRHKLLTHLVQAAKQTVFLALSDNTRRSFIAPGMITLIQTAGDELNFNCHLHALITDGVVNYAEPNNITLQRCFHYDFQQITELFRLCVLRLLFKHHVIVQNVVDNMVTWKNSGFHVHVSEPFTDSERMRTCLEYSFRAPVTLNRLKYDQGHRRVCYTTKKNKSLVLKANDFIAAVIQHIPDRYQNMRRYAGFYAANVRLRIERAKAESCKDVTSQNTTRTDDVPVVRETSKVAWASLIARIFGDKPTQCPQCGDEMRLVGFDFDTRFLHDIPQMQRAPPKIKVVRYAELPAQLIMERAQSGVDNQTAVGSEQIMPDYENADQSISW